MNSLMFCSMLMSMKLQMNKKLTAATVISVLLAFGNTIEVFTQQPQATVAGGYKITSTLDSEVTAAAKFAVSRENRKHSGRSSLVSVEHAETQAVAGTNYRLCLRIKKSGKKPHEEEVIAVVYQDLRQRYSLASWKVESCRKSD